MLGVGATALVSHAAGPQGPRARALVFNQSQVLSLVVGAGRSSCVDDGAARPRSRAGMSADAETTRLAGEYLRWFIPAMALQFAMVAMGAALRGTGNFKPGMIVQTATVILNIVLAPVLIFGWGTGRPLGVAGAAIASFVAVVVGVAGSAIYFVGHAATCSFARARLAAASSRCGARMLEIGLPAGRGVRADGRLPGRRLRRSRGRSAPRRRPASASACA